ncbi:hypothetical protein Tco_1185327 [Tanacetum coccineum]
MFQQHQDESLYDVWTRFKNLIQRVPHHGLNLWSLAQFFYDHVDRYTKIDINHATGGNLRILSVEEAWETIEDCAQCDKQWKNPTSIISDQTIANLKAQLVENEVVRIEIPKCMAWLDDEPIEVEEIIEIPIEAESLDHMKLEDLGLNTSTHDLFLSSRGFPSVDEPEPQPLPNLPFLDVNLGDKRGTDPPINPYSLAVLG